MNLILLTENHPLLKTKSKNYDLENNLNTLVELTDSMFACMLVNGGVGLSAIQVGLAFNVFVMSIDNKNYVVVNPKIIEKSENAIIFNEGCLSFPGIYLKISRKDKVKVEYYDVNGKFVQEWLTGTAARVFLHEEEHLRGLTFNLKVPKREFLKAKLKRNLI